jgi:phosphonate transport system substrate-binding protein
VAERPLRVLILPVDGGTADGTLADYRPSFDAVARFSGLRFDLKVGQTYAAVIEAIAIGAIDIAQFAVGSYTEAARRGPIEPLAIQVIEGTAVYYGAIFVPTASPARTLADLRHHSIAFADLSSTSSFIYPAAMLLAAGVDARRDFDRVIVAGSHSAVLQALAEGRVDAAGASLASYERALNSGLVRPGQVRILARSAPIPNPFLAMRSDLPALTKEHLRTAFARLDQDAARAHLVLRGYGGRRLDRWSVRFADALGGGTAATIGLVDPAFRSAVARQAADR